MMTCRKFYSLLLLIAFFITTFFVFYKVPAALASDRAYNHGYFYNRTFTDEGNKVLRNTYHGTADGVPASVNSKSKFINFILDLYNSRSTTYDAKNNKVGAAYIIQTMRGPDANGSWDHSFPTESDITDWKAKINNPQISYINNQSYSASINTKTTTNNVPGHNTQDVVKYEGDNSYLSIIFSKDGKAVYVIKRACGNPLGSLPGLPPPPSEEHNDATVNISVNPTEIDPGGLLTVSPYIEPITLDSNDTDIGWSVVGKSGVVQSGNWPTYPSSFNNQDTDYPVGTDICYTISFRGKSATDCSKVVKKPKVQILGGDLVSFGKNSTLQSPSNGKLFGSWVEYGIFASDGITGLASGAALSGGTNESTQCQYSPLSFSNDKCSSGSVGYFSNMPLAPDVAASFPVNQNTKKVGQSFNLDGLQGIYTSSSDLTISSSSMAKGQWAVINVPKATVTISGDINSYSGSLASINDLSQLIIIAKDIIIKDNVTNVDSWLVAKDGSIKTCPAPAYTTNTCNQPLRVNGPVIASHLYLYRTGGSDDMNSLDKPAEVFNLPASAYLWSYARASSGRFMQTVYTTELPARF